MFSILKNLFSKSNPVMIQNLIKDGAFLVDVRSPSEFSQGCAKGSVNIPLEQVSHRLTEFSGKKHIIVFCRSGNRSGMAKAMLEKNGFTNIVNGGTWQDIDRVTRQ